MHVAVLDASTASAASQRQHQLSSLKLDPFIPSAAVHARPQVARYAVAGICCLGPDGVAARGQGHVSCGQGCAWARRSQQGHAELTRSAALAGV